MSHFNKQKCVRNNKIRPSLPARLTRWSERRVRFSSHREKTAEMALQSILQTIRPPRHLADEKRKSDVAFPLKYKMAVGWEEWTLTMKSNILKYDSAFNALKIEATGCCLTDTSSRSIHTMRHGSCYMKFKIVTFFSFQININEVTLYSPGIQYWRLSINNS